MQQILSAATVTAVGLTCKAYLYSGLCSISVHGLPFLLDALYSSKRQNGPGILTGERVVSNPTTAKEEP
jgi:monolysocardiolipin acyltransferase